MRPILNRIVVEEYPAEDVAIGSIILPGNIEQRLRKGKVLAVGPGMWLLDGTRADHGIRVGDEVIYREVCAIHLQQFQGMAKYSVLSADDILVVL